VTRTLPGHDPGLRGKNLDPDPSWCRRRRGIGRPGEHFQLTRQRVGIAMGGGASVAAAVAVVAAAGIYLVQKGREDEERERSRGAWRK
jgi:hypothetical protein